MKTTKFLLAIAAALGAVWLGGCDTPASRIEKNPEIFARLNPDQQALVRAGQVALGFDMDTVKLALGDPDRITQRTDAAGQTQVWHYVTYESDGVILYTGFYHRGWRHGGGWWGGGAGYPYYLDYPNRVPHDRFVVEFKDGRVTSVQVEVADHTY